MVIDLCLRQDYTNREDANRRLNTGCPRQPFFSYDIFFLYIYIIPQIGIEINIYYIIYIYMYIYMLN